MSALAVVGVQWGDEGKGKVVDLLAQAYSAVIRFNGGNNAGHTIKNDLGVFKLNVVPSGIFHPGVSCFVGTGCVIDLAVLIAELESLKSRGVDVSMFRLSALAHLILPWHVQLDRLGDGVGMASKVGTTGRGIGPCYADKMLRRGLRVFDLLESDLGEKVRRLHAMKSAELETFLPGAAAMLPSAGVLTDTLRAAGERLRDCIADTDHLARKFVREGHSVLLEGAQGTMIDIDFGTYPYVTSSSATSAGAAVGSGLPPHQIDQVIGVAKAYTTRVGEGPMPSEMTAQDAERFRQKGGEFGTTTGRARRCGWFDAPQVKYACQLNGTDSLVLTKLDVLSGMGPINVVTAYEFQNDGFDVLAPRYYGSPELTPIMVGTPGWSEDISGIKHWSELPAAARSYVELLESLVGVRISAVGTGPGRDDIIFR